MDKEEKINAMIKYIKDKYNCGNLYTMHLQNCYGDWVE